ncbi:hypothetical protein Nepgr_015146 [Nepenthes gracilis]|uniref:ubiquitinyl hydrolase 1 n=1 Tax=Nepenthes gracilis TaxID=150966 RepID=A0AAD3XR69_NEPGR|nr:hypothetical protein Nepgr_015146 [Nepenthes gracilis]
MKCEERIHSERSQPRLCKSLTDQLKYLFRPYPINRNSSQCFDCPLFEEVSSFKINQMTACGMDADVVRWGLHQLCARPTLKAGSHGSVTLYDADLSHDAYVLEGYCEEVSANVENDEIIAHALQEEFSRLAVAEASGSSDGGAAQQQASILAQDWHDHVKGESIPEHADTQEVADDTGSCPSGSPVLLHGEGWPQPPEMTDESALDGELSKRLNHMVPVPHVPRVNGEIPSDHDAESDHQRLLDRLNVYELVEMKVEGDGNCQFRSLSDQIYRTVEHHNFVRQQVVVQLKSHSEMYEGYVLMPYADYLKKMSKSGEWGDHVTLQAAADRYGIKIFVLTSFRDTCYIEILPRTQKSNRVIFLSFWAEVHYNSIYPEGELPVAETKKNWRRWLFGP